MSASGVGIAHTVRHIDPCNVSKYLLCCCSSLAAGVAGRWMCSFEASIPFCQLLAPLLLLALMIGASPPQYGQLSCDDHRFGPSEPCVWRPWWQALRQILIAMTFWID
jgi:hypothetical protein